MYPLGLEAQEGTHKGYTHGKLVMLALYRRGLQSKKLIIAIQFMFCSTILYSFLTIWEKRTPHGYSIFELIIFFSSTTLVSYTHFSPTILAQAEANSGRSQDLRSCWTAASYSPPTLSITTPFPLSQLYLTDPPSPSPQTLCSCLPHIILIVGYH